MSSKISWALYEDAHFDKLKAKEIFKGDGPARHRLATLLRNPNAYCYTILRELEPIAFCGIIQLFPGTGEVWSLTSDAVKRSPISFHKLILQLLEAHENTLGIHRMQMSVKQDYQEGIRWAWALGFQSEGIMRKYGPDKSNHILFARVK